MSFKLKVALLFSSLLLASMGALTSILLWSERRAVAEALSRQKIQTAESLAEVCRGTIFSQQDLHAANYLRRLKSRPEVLEGSCVDRSGRIFAHTDVALLGKPSAAGPGGPDAAVLTAPIALDGSALGTASVVFDRSVMEEKLRGEMSAARRRLFRLAAPVAVAGFCGAFILTAMLLKPLGLVVDGARAIGGGRLTHVIPLDRGDELGVLAREFNQMAVKLQELDRMKEDFVNGVTHDLKSPLATILAATESARRAADADARGQALDAVRNKAAQLGDLVTSILEVAKIESGLILHKAPGRLEDLAGRALAAYGPEAARKGLALEHVLESPLPEMAMDGGKMERVVNNLVGNAVKFTDRGGVDIRTGARGGNAVLEVADTGPGLPDEFLARAFVKFSRASGPAAKKEGTGLGLSIAKGIVEAHGGTLTAANGPRGGAVFTVSLPLR